MWYGGSYRECKRGEQARQAYSVISKLGLHENTKFEYLRKLGIGPIESARIIHLLSNPDFGVERYVEG